MSYLFYNVHYPDGVIQKHRTHYNNGMFPALDKVFYNYKQFDENQSAHCFQIVEMSEEDIWVEEISHGDYNKFLYKGDGFLPGFAYFEMEYSDFLTHLVVY